jgi:hypothetical protein
MKHSNQRIYFLSLYREQLNGELDQMKYGQVSKKAAMHTSAARDRVSGVIAIAAMTLIFASIFLVQ